MQVEIIHSLKQNNLYLSYPSNMQIISQEHEDHQLLLPERLSTFFSSVPAYGVIL